VLATVLVAMITVAWVLGNNPSLHPEYIPAYLGIAARSLGLDVAASYVVSSLAAVPREAWVVVVLGTLAVAAYARSVAIADRRPARARCPRR